MRLALVLALFFAAITAAQRPRNSNPPNSNPPRNSKTPVPSNSTQPFETVPPNPGQVDFVPASGNVPAYVQLRAGEIACNLTTSAAPEYAGGPPSRWVFMTCWNRGKQTNSAMPLFDSSLTLSMNGSPHPEFPPECDQCQPPRDSVALTITAEGYDISVPLKWDAVAQPAGGTAAHNSGNL